MKYFILFLTFFTITNASCNIKNDYIHDCNFTKQNFENYNFSKKTLENIDFSEANLFGAVFNKTKLKNVNFSKANLFGTFFVEASLKYVNFHKADISSADFTGITLSATDFKTATQEDTVFGEMLIEQDDVIKVKNCKMIIPIKLKQDWYTAMLGLALDSGHSDEFIIGGLCKWHKHATFKLKKIVDISKKKKKFLLNYNACNFAVYVSTDSKNIHLKDMYNKVCIKHTPSYNNDENSGLKVFECTYQCRTSGFVFYDHLEFSMTVKAYKFYEAESKVEDYANKQCNSMIGRETGLRMWDTSIHCN